MRGPRCAQRGRSRREAANFVSDASVALLLMVSDTRSQRKSPWCGRSSESSATRWEQGILSSMRVKGQIARRKRTANPNMKPCARFVSAGKYDKARNHSNARSKLCFFHKMNEKDILQNAFGSKPLHCAVKTSLQNALNLKGSDEEIFQENVCQLTEKVREAMIKSQLFATHFILYWMEKHSEMPAIFFTQQFFYKTMQLVCQVDVSSNDELEPANTEFHLPVQEMEEEFKTYRRIHKHTTMSGPIYMNPLAAAAVNAAMTFTNYVTEQYKKIAITYIEFKISKEMKVRRQRYRSNSRLNASLSGFEAQ